jgi:hypothetical protein
MIETGAIDATEWKWFAVDEVGELVMELKIG